MPQKTPDNTTTMNQPPPVTHTTAVEQDEVVVYEKDTTTNNNSVSKQEAEEEEQDLLMAAEYGEYNSDDDDAGEDEALVKDTQNDPHEDEKDYYDEDQEGQKEEDYDEDEDEEESLFHDEEEAVVGHPRGNGRNSRIAVPVPQDKDDPSTSSQPPPPQAPKKEINRYYRQVRETGRWGDISKKEIYAALAFVVVAIVAAVVLSVVLLGKKDDDNNSNDNPSAPTRTAPAPTPAPTPAMVLEPQDELAYVRQQLSVHPILQSQLNVLPPDITFYQDNKRNDPSAAPAVRAMSWLAFDDDVDHPDTLLIRYALAVLYYSTNGDTSWTTKTNWLSNEHHCAWFGLDCDRFGVTLEIIDLPNNNLSGPIPPELALLTTLRGFQVTGNMLSGPLPSEALGSLPQLTILYLDDNQLTGEVSPALRANGVLGTLFIQQNGFAGVFPLDFCPQFVGDPPVLNEFGMDCDMLTCFCCTELNCF